MAVVLNIPPLGISPKKFARYQKSPRRAILFCFGYVGIKTK